MKPRSLKWLACAALAATTLIGVGATSLAAQSDPVTISIWKGPHSDSDQTFFDDHLAACLKDTNIKTEYRVVPWANWEETTTAAFSAGTPPDVTYFPGSFYPKYAAAGQLLDLSTVAKDELNTTWKPLFDDSIWQGGIQKDVVYGLPFIQGGISLVWNKAEFKEAGLDPDTPPKTWDELLEFAQKLTKKDAAGNVTQWGYSIIDNTTGIMLNYVPVAIVNYGGDLTNADNTEWTADNEGNVAGLQFQVDLINKYKVAPPFGTYVGEATDKAFADGEVAMQLNYASFVLPLLKDKPDFQLGVGMPPGGPKNDYSLGAAGYWTISSATKDPDAAWTVVKCLSAPDLVSEYSKLTQQFPARTDVHPYADDPTMQAFAETQKNYMRLPLLPFDFWPIFMQQAESALSGQTTAQAALDETKKQIDDLIANSQ